MIKNINDLKEVLKEKIPKINKLKRAKNAIIGDYLTFDIEVSSYYIHNEKRSNMYVFALCYEEIVYFGRTWIEFIDIINYLDSNLNERRMLIFVHNLSYEFQFIRKYFNWAQVFATEERKVIYARLNNVEFRCSYFLSGYSLDTLAKNLTNYKIRKLKEIYNYSLLRTPITPLTAEEYLYLNNDCLIVYYYIKELLLTYKQMRFIPLTNTGKVRKQLFKNMGKKQNYKDLEYLRNHLKCDLIEYYLLKECFQGGFTHSNIYRTNIIINDVHSYDFTSSYPFVLLSEMYPMGSGILIDLEKENINEILKNYCVLMSVTFTNIENIFKYENYISKSKCIILENAIVENGRVRKASKLSITINEQDFFIIRKLYKYTKFTIHKAYKYPKAYLPKSFINTIIDLYKIKTEYKGVDEKILEYQNAKGMLNSLYGMCVTNIIRDEIVYNNEWSTIINDEVKNLELIFKYNESKKRTTFYPWGVWCTSYARRNLFTAIYELKEDYIYSDTDSVKFTNLEKHLDYFNNYNLNTQIKLKNMCNKHKIDYTLLLPKTIKGEIKPIGVFDYEGKYDFFKTLGAKRYMYIKDNNLHITISGVSKKASNYLIEKYGTPYDVLINFKDGLYFEKGKCGKLCHTYIDEEYTENVIDYLGNTCLITEKSSVHLEESDYTLSLGNDYLELLNILLKGAKYER